MQKNTQRSISGPQFRPWTARSAVYFRAAVQAMDCEIGRLLAGLADQLPNTAILFVGDNGTPGEAALAPFDASRAKYSIYEGGINVPLIISGQAVANPGREVNGLVSTIDLFSTVLDLAGVDLEAACAKPRIVDSVSLYPYLVNPRKSFLRTTVYTEKFRGLDPNTGASTIRDFQYKLIVRGGHRGEHELYDLLADPFEHNDLFCFGCLTPEARQHYEALLSKMNAIRTSEP